MPTLEELRQTTIAAVKTPKVTSYSNRWWCGSFIARCFGHPTMAPQHSSAGVSTNTVALSSSLARCLLLNHWHIAERRVRTKTTQRMSREDRRKVSLKNTSFGRPNTACRQPFSHLPKQACSRHIRVAPGNRHSEKCRSATSSRDCRATHTCQFLSGIQKHITRGD